MISASPRAEAPDLLQVRAAVGAEHQSNVLRAPSGEKSDDIGIASIGLKLDRHYGLQHFSADVDASAYRYRNFSELDYTTLNYTAAWDWKFTPALHGVLSAERRQFRDISDSVTGLSEIGRRTERNELLEGIYDIDGAWRALAGVSHASSSTTVPESWDGSPTVRSARVGIGYEWASGSSLYARLRRGDGEYKALIAATASPDFQESEADVTLKWALTGKTTVDARVGHLKRTHDSAPARDFSGAIGGANVTWNATGKTTVVAGVQRYLSSSGLDTGGHVESNRFYVGPVWKPTAKTSVNLRYDRTARNWRDIAPGTPQNGRRDIIESTTLGVDWEATRIVTVSASLRGERVKSNVVGGSYRNNAAAVAVKVSF